jgi:carbonic anhydrase
MNALENLLEQNREWAESMTENDPSFFEKLSELQKPEYLWIGCSDSRITPVTSVGLLPGEMFVHRNIANLVIHTDMNCLSVMHFAVEVLQVRHIIVCGHYGCGGVIAAFQRQRLGLIDNWLRHIEDTARKYADVLEKLETDELRIDKLCEINIIEQVDNAAETTIVQDAWLRGQDLTIHGWIYSIKDGLYRDLGVPLKNIADMENLRQKLTAVKREAASVL